MTLAGKIREAIETRENLNLPPAVMVSEVKTFYALQDKAGLVDLFRALMEFSLSTNKDVTKPQAAAATVDHLEFITGVADETLLTSDEEYAFRKTRVLTLLDVGPTKPGPIRSFYRKAINLNFLDSRLDVDARLPLEGLIPEIVYNKATGRYVKQIKFSLSL